ncbi:MAG: alkaline phosphatase family protein [Dermatophilaceae bacterium]
MSSPTAPDYCEGTLASVLPSVLASLGSTRYAGRPLLPLAPARRAVVVLVDALGDELVRRRRGHAPFLRSGLDTAYRLTCGFPSTTATSTATFGTGLPPGAHGLVGFEVLVPETDRILNQLSWEDGPDPRQWQPNTTVFQEAQAEGIAVTRIGPGYFDGSGLTEAALRGGAFAPALTLEDGVSVALTAVRSAPRALVYLYWGDLDKIGHVHGCHSWQWGLELERIDRELARLVASVPSDTAVYVTADHGMVDVPFEQRIDLAHEPALLAGVRHVGGEARSVQLYCEAHAVSDVAAAWRARVEGAATVTTREAAIDEGWFGPVRDVVAPRIGDVIVNCTGELAVVDSERMRRFLLSLLGLHGSVTLDETAVPLFHWPARAAW